MIIVTESFKKVLSTVLKAFAKSEKSITDYATTTSAKDNIQKDQLLGDRYPGFGEQDVRKIRKGMPEHKISKSDGLRLLYLRFSEQNKVLPFNVYKKDSTKEITRNQQNKEMLKKSLDDIKAGNFEEVE